MTYSKNLKAVKKLDKTGNILGQKKSVISADILDPNKVLDKVNLLNDKAVNSGLAEKDIEYLGEVIDMDLYKENIWNFENLPKLRLAKEKAILLKGPTHIKGCRKAAARARWMSKQRGRVSSAESELKKHNDLLKEFDDYKTAKEGQIEQDNKDIEKYYAEKQNNEIKEKGIATTNLTEALEEENMSLVQGSMSEIMAGLSGVLSEVDTVINYEIVESKSEKKKKKSREKDNKKKTKNANKSGNEAEIDDVKRSIEIEQNILDAGEENENVLEQNVRDADLDDRVELKDIATLFKDVLLDGQNNPFKKYTNDEKNKQIIAENIDSRYLDVKRNAEKVAEYAKKLNISIPEELNYIIELDNNPILKGKMEKFDPKTNTIEAYILLVSSISKVYYESLNRFAGYYAFDGLNHYADYADEERFIHNYDILNKNLMIKVRNMRDMSSAYANEIRKKRIEIFDRSATKEELENHDLKINSDIFKDAQPVNKTEKQVVIEEEKEDPEKIYKEWKDLIQNDIRGVVEVDDKDMKKMPWVIADYAEDVLKLMKANPGLEGLKGEELKRYLIGINENLYHNLMQLTDELPKTSVGAKFCYVPKMRDDFIEKIKKERFGMLLRSDFHYRELLRNNKILDDLFDAPQYAAIKNRQRAIMEAINEELGIKFFTDARSLSSLWADEQIQALLISEPADKMEQEKALKEDLLKEDNKEENKEGSKKKNNILEYAISRILGKSKDYGITDQNFKNTIEKIKANVHNNIAVVDRKISIMGLCDTAKDMLKRSVIKNLGGEYLLGYSIVSEDIVEYTVDNMMSFDGHAAEVQRTWDRKFNRTGLPKRLSAKIERMVSKKVNKKGENSGYYLKPKGFKTSKTYKKRWNEVNEDTNKIIDSLRKLYENDIKDLLQRIADSDETRKAVSNSGRQYVGDKLKLTRDQWSIVDEYFENVWLESFKDAYIKGKYNKKIVTDKLPDVKAKVVDALDKQLTAAYNIRKKLEKEEDKSGLKDYEETLITRNEYQEGLKENPVILAEYKQVAGEAVVTKDIEEHIFNDSLLQKAFRAKEDKDLFIKVLGNLLKDKKSLLHTKYPYLEDVGSVEQIANLGLIDYSQFFADLKASLLIVGSLKDEKAGDKLLIDDWRMSGTGGADAYGVKEKLLSDFLTGNMTAEVYKTKIAKYEEDARNALSLDKMRIDAILASDSDPNNTYLKFNYLKIDGNNVNQVERIRRINLAEKLWKFIQKGDENLREPGKYFEREDLITKLIQQFLKTVKGLKPKAVATRIKELGAFIEKMDIQPILPGEGVESTKKWKIDKSTEKKMGYFFGKGFKPLDLDLEALKNMQYFYQTIYASDTSENKLKLSDIFGEVLLFGCGKEYYGAGGEGEAAFLNSDDNQYYADIAKRSDDFITKKQSLDQSFNFFKLDPVTKHQISTRLKPVIAGLEISQDKDIQARNIKKYGVFDLLDLQGKLMELYGEDEKCPENLKKSEELGKLYLRRREYIDNYGDPKKKQSGKFRVIRDYMLRDTETWKKVMTASDSEFEDFMKEQDKKYGTALNVMMNDTFRGSMPINEQYVMANWDVFESRKNWTEEQWYNSLLNYHDSFNNKKINGKSILKILQSVQDRMVKEGIDESHKKGTILMKMTYILSSDPASFALLYSEKDMFEAIKKIDKQYKNNMEYFREVTAKASLKDQKGQSYSVATENDALYKEVAEVYYMGEGVKQTKEKMGSTKILRDLDQKQEITKEDEIFADYSLLMQIIGPQAYMLNESDFRFALLDNLKRYQEAKKLDRNAHIYSDRTVLEAKERTRLELELKKGEGRMLQRDFDSKLADYREKKLTLGSIGLVAYNADPKFDKKEIDKAARFIDENLGDNYGEAEPEFIKGLLVERAIAYGKLDDQKLKDYLFADKERLVRLDSALREQADNLPEDEIKKAIVFAFAQNATRMGAPLDGTHKGDIKEIIDELRERTEAISIVRPKSILAQREYDEFMEEMDMARFTMSLADYKEICDKKKKYFEAADRCALRIEEKSSDLDVQLGLFDLLKKDIFEAIKNDTDISKLEENITGQIDKLLGDKVALSYIPDSRAIMQQISSDRLTATERLSSSANYTRADVEKEIALSGRKDLIDEYNKLTVEEQKVFALVLTFPDIGLTESEKLTSNVALHDKEKELKKENELQETLAAFIYGQDFAPNIDYNVVMRRLLKTDKKSGLKRVSKTMFDKAMQYTQFCMAKKIEMMPKDFDKLSDGRLSAEAGRELASNKINDYKIIQEALDNSAYYGPKTFKSLFQKFADSDIKSDSSVAKIAERFGKYNDVQMYMLLHVLQDRTAVDYTTADGKWKAFMLNGVSFVNVQRREELKNSFLRPDGMDKEFIAQLNRSMDNNMYEKAAATLFSYQIRDNVQLDGALKAGDFAGGALDRKTQIDWKMLERAMDLIEEIENENLRIQICRQTTKHTTDENAPNKEARILGKEIDGKFREGAINHFDYFNDFLIREAKKSPEQAMPLISAFSGMSMNEKMLVVHALKNRDILDVSTDNTFTTAIGMNENQYVNETGRDRLADYYIDHLSVPGAANIIATTQYDVRDALESLVSTQISDRRDSTNKKTYADMMEGKKIFNWVYVGGRKTGVDWNLFGNALKFAKRTENERKLLVGESESYRASGNIDKYGRFMYNYKFMRKNLYRSGYRLTRFMGRRIRAEVEGAIPGYGVGQRIMMVCLSPQMRNKMLSSGAVKPGVSKNTTTDVLGYAGLGGTSVKAVSSALAMVSKAAQAGAAVGGEGLEQAASAFAGLYNVIKDSSKIKNINKPMENEEELRLESVERLDEAKKRQTKEQSIVTKDNQLNKDWILNEVAGAAVQSANVQDIVETATTCINVLSGSSFGVQAITNFFVGGIRATISEIMHGARFIMSVVSDKKMMDRYFADEGPLGKEIKNLKGENIDKIIKDQTGRKEIGSRDILENSSLKKSETEFMDKMSNSELFRKAYGFKDFSEQASYVGWNIVQTLLQSASPYGADVRLFLRASLLLAALGCKDAIGKQDNDTAQRVYNKLMGQDIR